MLSPIRTLLSKSLIQLKIGCKSFSDVLFIFLSSNRFTLCKPFSNEFENLRSKWLFGLPEPSISGYKKDFCYDGYNVYSSKTTGATHLVDMDGKILHRLILMRLLMS